MSGRAVVRLLAVLLALGMVVLGAMNIVGSLGQDSKRVQQTYSGVKVVDVHVTAESVEVREGVGDTTRLDRTITWSLRTPTMVQRQVGVRSDQVMVRSNRVVSPTPSRTSTDSAVTCTSTTFTPE